MLNLLIYIILILSATGAIIGWQGQKKGMRWGQPLTILCALLAIFLGFFQTYVTSVGGLNKQVASTIRQREYNRAQGIILGRHLKNKFRGKKAVIIKDPTRTQESDALIALRKEIYHEIEVVAIVAPVPKIADTEGAAPDGFINYEPTERWYTKKTLEQLLAGKKFDILITDIGLPSELTVIGKDFTSSALKGKRVAFLSGGIYDYVRAFMSGRIAAAVVSNPKAVFDAKNVPKDPEAAFNKRYLLITPENYKEMIEQYNIFKR